MKKISLLVTAVLISTVGFSQAFDQGNAVFTIGYGFPNLSKIIFKTYEDNAGYKASGMGPVHVKFDYGLSDKISMGVSINYLQTNVEWEEVNGLSTSSVYDYTYKYSTLSILPRLNIHFATTDMIDPYVGFGAGYRYASYKIETNNPLGGEELSGLVPVGFETTVGLRVYFTDLIGVYMEMGIAKSVIQGGLSIKL